MEKIIVVYGESNTGKTTVINGVYDDLINHGANVIKPKKRIGGNPKDFEVVVNFQGKTVAFLSMGDYRRAVDQYVQSFSVYDVFITALNECFMSISADWLRKSDVIYKIYKAAANDNDNQQVLNTVISKIR